MNAKTENVGPLSEDEVREGLSTHNVEIIEELYKLIHSHFDGENDRGKALDSKAASLFSVVGILISVNLVALGALSGRGDQPLAFVFSTIVGKVAVGLILVLLVASVIFLYITVKVKAVQGAPGDRDLFSAIGKYDGYSVKRKENAPLPDAHLYRRHLCEHYWKLYKNLFERNEKKAHFLGFGQDLLFAALVALVAIQAWAVVISPTVSTTKTTNIDKTPCANTSAAQAVPTQGSARPTPLPASSKGTYMKDSARPRPLEASSAGKDIKLDEGAISRPTKSK